MGTRAGDDSLIEQARQYIKVKYRKPGNVYLGVVSRLDAFVTGVIVLARTSKAASRLTEQFRGRTVEKTYWAILNPAPATDRACLRHWLRKNDAQRCMETVPEGTPGAQEATLTYQVLAIRQGQALTQVTPETGRKHQIRVQLAAIECPIVGDRKYKSRYEFPRGIALHSRSLIFDHPTRPERITLNATTPAYWPSFPGV